MYCFPDVPYGRTSSAEVTGALVLEPKVGLFAGVQNYDVKQMYPSIMINERVSPDKARKLIPDILLTLRRMRRELKAKYEETKSTQDYILQYNYKVLANIFYGAYAMPYCRIYDNKFANFITAKGQRILRQIMEISEAMGHEVLYGDTDSVFVKIHAEDVDSLLSVINDSHISVRSRSGGIL